MPVVRIFTDCDDPESQKAVREALDTAKNRVEVPGSSGATVIAARVPRGTASGRSTVFLVAKNPETDEAAAIEIAAANLEMIVSAVKGADQRDAAEEARQRGRN